MYHIFFPWLYPCINDPIISLLPGLSFHSIFVITLLQNSAVLILVSWISYSYLERPIMRLGTPPVKISGTSAPLEPAAQGLT
jgi:peptidoglycan/LPS O-acetylase OafA/YrhL